MVHFTKVSYRGIVLIHLLTAFGTTACDSGTSIRRRALAQNQTGAKDWTEELRAGINPVGQFKLRVGTAVTKDSATSALRLGSAPVPVSTRSTKAEDRTVNIESTVIKDPGGAWIEAELVAAFNVAVTSAGTPETSQYMTSWKNPICGTNDHPDKHLICRAEYTDLAKVAWTPGCPSLSESPLLTSTNGHVGSKDCSSAILVTDYTDNVPTMILPDGTPAPGQYERIETESSTGHPDWIPPRLVYDNAGRALGSPLYEALASFGFADSTLVNCYANPPTLSQIRTEEEARQMQANVGKSARTLISANSGIVTCDLYDTRSQ